MVHEELRQTLCSLNSPLWLTDDGKLVALCLVASIPSGVDDVVDIRSEILGNLVGDGWCQKSFTITIVDHPPDVSMSSHHGARVIYVGHPRGTLQCTPWVNSCSMGTIKAHDSGTFDFVKYCSMRADCDEWIIPLFGCHLVCSCSFVGLKCHARYLQHLCVEKVKHDANNYNHGDQGSRPCCQNNDYYYDDTHDEVDHPGRITDLDETLIGESPPRHVNWPESWTHLVHDLRMLPNKAFWELFSGSARATAGFSDAGWSCGRPVDVADDASFNLLDPAFLAIVIVLIWDGLIAVLWLGPPCSSFSMAVNLFGKHACDASCSLLVSHGLMVLRNKKC